MKTAISIPDALFKEAQAAAKELGISRSKLIRIALEAFLDRRRGEEVTRRLNESYAKRPGKIDPFLQNLALEAMKRVEWKD
jgi:Arc/MetJ-type ribon-helix-helix transcriptional regulator